MQEGIYARKRNAVPTAAIADFDAGHGVGFTRSQSDALYADAFAFVLWRTGASGFQPS